MSLFKKIFGGQSEKPKSDNGPTPTRPLNLKFPPVPENGHRLAQGFVDAVKNNENKELDYSPATLDFVDRFLQKFREEGLTVNDFAETIFVAGSYVGQVMIRNNHGTWIKQEDAKLPTGVTMMPIVVQLPNGTITDPIAKAFKRFHYGEVDDIKHYYQAFTSTE